MFTVVAPGKFKFGSIRGYINPIWAIFAYFLRFFGLFLQFSSLQSCYIWFTVSLEYPSAYVSSCCPVVPVRLLVLCVLSSIFFIVGFRLFCLHGFYALFVKISENRQKWLKIMFTYPRKPPERPWFWIFPGKKPINICTRKL